MTGLSLTRWLRLHWRAVLLTLGVALFALQSLRLELARAKVRQLGFDKLEIVARADTQRLLNEKATRALVALYGDNARGVEKLIVQVADANTKLGQALGQQTKVTAELALSIRDLKTTVTSGPVVTDTADVRHAVFVTDSIRPYHVRDSVSLPPSPRAGTSRLWIRMDPITLNTHTGCLPKNADGLRPASTTVSADSVYQISLGAQTADREVCNPPRYRGFSLRVPLWFTAVVGIGSFIGGYVAPHP